VEYTEAIQGLRMHKVSAFGKTTYFSMTLHMADFLIQAVDDPRSSQSFNDNSVIRSYVYIALDKVGKLQSVVIQSL
jgi:hypothetical protein